MTKVKIGPLDPDMELSGYNCKVTIDGKVIDGINDIQFNLSALGAPELILTMNADVEIDGNLEPFVRKEEVLKLVIGAGDIVGHVKV